MKVCVPVASDGSVDPRWGRADRLAVVDVVDGVVSSWDEVDVWWSRQHDEGSDARHHARVARFLREHEIDELVVHHMGDGMARMMATMGIRVHGDASGDARAALDAALGLTT